VQRTNDCSVRQALDRSGSPPDCWQVYYGDVCVGTIARRTGCPVDVDQWGLRLLPRDEAWSGRGGSAVDFEQARAGFEAAWRRLLPTLTEANFKEWRDQRDWTAKKYAIWAHGAN
jgi:hypothetical protein